jgi:hypothetical protein
MKHRISNNLPPTRDILLPESLENLGGPTVVAEVEVLALKEDRGLALILSINSPVAWIENFEAVEFSVLRDGATFKAFKKAGEEDYRRYRVPLWIQGDEVPICCDHEMIFVGQIDDDTICTEPPVGAKLWWHDRASFYVFTCPKCLTTTAVGQQF